MYPKPDQLVFPSSVKQYNYRVILFYAWTNYRKALLEQLENNSSHNILYYQISSHHNNFRHWSKSLLKYLAGQFPAIQENSILIEQQSNPEIMGALLGKAQQKATFPHTILFLEGLETVPQDQAMQAFMTAWVKHMPEQFQLAMTTHLATMAPWAQLIDDEQAVVLGTRQTRGKVMFVPQIVEKPQIEVYALNGGMIFINGREVTVKSRKLAYRLALFLLDIEQATRQEIFDVFWPDTQKKDATNRFHVNKRKIAEMLWGYLPKDQKIESITAFEHQFYSLSDSVVWHYDAAEFLQCVMQAIHKKDDDALQESLLIRAISIYQTPFLPSVKMRWVEKRREELQEAYLTALEALARLYKKQGNSESALELFQQILEINPSAEHIVREVMWLHHESHNFYQVQQAFCRLKAYLVQEQLAEPDVKTKDLFNIIKAEYEDKP